MIRFSTPLEEVPEGQPSLLERISVFLCRFPEEKDIFTNCVKDRVALAKGREELEAGTMPLDEYGVEQFQTEPLIASDVYEQCCQVVLSTKGSSTLCAALNSIIDGSLSAPRKRALRAFLNYLWVLQNSKAANGLDSIALATRFGNYMVRPPSGRDPILSRVKLMGALAILIESVPRTMGPKQSSVNDLLTRSSPSSSIDNSSGGSASPIFTSDKPHNSGSAKSAIPIVTRTQPSVSNAGMQTVDIARSAVIVIDSAQKTLVKLQSNVPEFSDKDKLIDLLKKLKYIESLLGTDGAALDDYAI